MGRIQLDDDWKSPYDTSVVLTPHTRYVTLDEDNVDAKIQEYGRSPSRHALLFERIGYSVVALLITLCLLVHVVGLLVFFMPSYNDSVQVWIFRRLYLSFESTDFREDLDAKRSAVAFVYLLFIGIVPTVFAASLWFAFSSHRGLRRSVQTASFLRRKPVFFSKWRPIYLDVTFGEIAMFVSLFTANAFIFIQVLARAKTHLSSPSEKLFHDVSRAFGYNAIFSMVWLLFFMLKPSSWSIYLDVFDVSTKTMYRTWLAITVGVCSGLHGVCMAISFLIQGEFTARMFPAWSVVDRDPAGGSAVFGEMAIAAMVAGALLIRLKHHLNASFAVLCRWASELVVVGALCMHYPLAVAWLLPFLLLLLIQRAAAWTHTSAPVELLDIAPLPYGITRIVVRRNVEDMATGGSNFTPGQFVYLNLPSVSRLHWQRCTIASSAGRNPSEIKLYVAEASSHSPNDHRSWSKCVYGVAARAYRDNQPPVVHVDGFYGPTHSIYYDKYRCIVLVAKNKGIIELLSMLEQLYHDAWRAKSEVFEPNMPRRFTALEDNDDLEACGRGARQVWLLWTIEDVCFVKEFEELFFRIQALDPTEEYFRLRFFLTKIPTREDLLYERVPACDFNAGTEQSHTPDGLRNDNPCRRQRRRPPQNHGGLGGWPSRPFQQALSGLSAKIVTLWIVLLTSALLAISGEGHTLNVTATKTWHALGSVLTVAVPLLIASAIAGTTSLLNDYIVSRQRRERKRQVHRIRRAQIATPTKGLTRLQSVNKQPDKAPDDEQYDPQPRDTELEPRDIGPDIMERFKIYTMKPDVGKFLRTVGRSFPRYAGRIGVFASGSERVVKHVEDCIIACDASADEWQDVNAAFDLHTV